MKSFYRYILTFRHVLEASELAMLAEHIYLDHTFPKQSSNYHELSSYLEMNGEYLFDMSLFDEAWELYLANHTKIE